MHITSSLYRELCSEQLPENPDTSQKIILLQRISEKVAQELQAVSTPPFYINIHSDLFRVTPSANLEKNSIKLPALFLLDLNDPAAPVHFNGPNDPKLKDRRKVQAFADWAYANLRLKRKKIRPLDVYNFRLFLETIEKPEMTKKALLFSIGHELAHIHYRHDSVVNTTLKVIILSILTLGIFLLILKSHLSRKCEKEADAFSFRGSKILAEGGLHLLDTIERSGNHTLLNCLIGHLFRLKLVFTHSSCKARIQRIKKHMKAMNWV